MEFYLNLNSNTPPLCEEKKKKKKWHVDEGLGKDATSNISYYAELKID